ncbi:MAG: tRNA lysidine(34) synthetase TilS [bacterium]|nr:tRNA lysidine(34) synthetase TilS [bacterium]
MTKPLLNPEWVVRLEGFRRLIVGYSGGLDSTVLLATLASQPSLHGKILAVHVNHAISANAIFWQQHCEQTCHNLIIPCISQTVTFDCRANIEERARIARYAVFTSVVEAQDALVLGHHLNDQAETMLLQLFRGAGVDGLAAMSESNDFGLGMLLRPFLSLTRGQLEAYAIKHQLQWIDDESNENTQYSRNYLRHEIMPLLIKKFPGVVGNIARAANHCQQAKVNLYQLAEQDMSNLKLISEHDNHNTLLVTPLKKLTNERITNVLRLWLKKHEVSLPSTSTLQRIIFEVIHGEVDTNPLVSWGPIQIRRFDGRLYLDLQNSIASTSMDSLPWNNFPLPIVLANGYTQIIAHEQSEGLKIPLNAKIVIRYRQGGELFFWHGQRKQLKKLFQQWHIPPWHRDSIPLIYINDELAAVVGYAISDLFYSSLKGWHLVSI